MAPRLDQQVVALGLARSRARARDAIARGQVTVNGAVIDRPGAAVGADAVIVNGDAAANYVSRSALKLIAGLDRFGYDPAGLAVLDLGASTGGFTQVLLERGAKTVFAVDVGHGQLETTLANDPRVAVLEKMNARHLVEEKLPRRPQALVCDVSFISVRLALPPALALAEPDAWGVILFKPQFELDRSALGKSGVVRDEDQARAAADACARWLESEMNWRVDGIERAPIAGADGNQEYLIGARRG
jgi:23S rRNA (cytidine1920-2'-O)/16S rRNA (cytidine1409-2'-O)-methyltransferase